MNDGLTGTSTEERADLIGTKRVGIKVLAGCIPGRDIVSVTDHLYEKKKQVNVSENRSHKYGAVSTYVELAKFVLHKPRESVANWIDVVRPEQIATHRIERDEISGIRKEVGQEESGKSEGRVEAWAEHTDRSEEA